MSTALGTPPAPAAGLAFGLAPLEGGRLLGAVTAAAPPARAVVVLLDASGSLVGPPLAGARALVDRLAAALAPRPVAVVAAGGTGPALLRAFGPTPGDAALPPAASAGRADLRRAAALVRAEAQRAAGGPAGIDLVLVSDLALPADEVEALRALEREGARLHAVLAPSPRPARPGLEPVARLDEGDPLAALLARLGASTPGRVVVDLARLPRAWFAWRAGRLEGGARASLARVERPSDDTVAFVVDALDAEVTLGLAWLAGDEERRASLELGRAGPVDPALVAAVRLATGGAP